MGRRDKTPAKQGRIDKFTAKKMSMESEPPGASANPPPVASEVTSNDILKAITESRELLEGKIGLVATEVSLIRHDMQKLTGRITKAEQRI